MSENEIHELLISKGIHDVANSEESDDVIHDDL